MVRETADPDGTLPAKEPRHRADHLRKAHFTELALKSAREIYDLVKSVDAKVDALNGQKLDSRITSLERWRYAIGGAYGLGLADLFLKIKGIA